MIAVNVGSRSSRIAIGVEDSAHYAAAGRSGYPFDDFHGVMWCVLIERNSVQHSHFDTLRPRPRATASSL